MRYLCLIYDDESKWGTMPKDQADAMMGEYFAFTEGVKTERPLRRRRGAAADADRHDRPRAATARSRRPTARSRKRRNSSAATTSSTRKDLNDAIQVAAKIPSARIGTIEIRPIMEFNQLSAGADRDERTRTDGTRGSGSTRSIDPTRGACSRR